MQRKISNHVFPQGCGDEKLGQVCGLRPRQREVEDADLHQARTLCQVPPFINLLYSFIFFTKQVPFLSSADQIVMIVCEAPLFLRKIAIRYIDIVAGLAITRYHDEKTIYVARSWNHPSSWNMFIVMCRDGNIVAVDSVTPTLFVISEGGDLLRW